MGGLTDSPDRWSALRRAGQRLKSDPEQLLAFADLASEPVGATDVMDQSSSHNDDPHDNANIFLKELQDLHVPSPTFEAGRANGQRTMSSPRSPRSPLIKSTTSPLLGSPSSASPKRRNEVTGGVSVLEYCSPSVRNDRELVIASPSPYPPNFNFRLDRCLKFYFESCTITLQKLLSLRCLKEKQSTDL